MCIYIHIYIYIYITEEKGVNTVRCVRYNTWMFCSI